MKLVFLSDTHCKHNDIVIPKCDILCYAGDFSSCGKTNEVLSFLNWFDSQSAEHKIYIAGNHDLSYERRPDFKKEMIRTFGNLHYLESSGINVCGLNIWGDPSSPRFGNWAFMLNRNDIGEKWAKIPQNTDILITHGPPHNILDTVSFSGEHAGCPELLETVKYIKPRIHAYGHIHQQKEQCTNIEDTLFVNCAICDDSYNTTYKPVVMEI